MADSPETTSSEPATAAPPSGLKARIPLIAALAGGLAVGAGSGAMLVGPMAARALGFSVSTEADHATAADDGHGADPNAAEGDSTAAASEPLVTTLDNLVLNPTGSGGTRFLLLTVAIECPSDAAMTTLKAKDAELRDVVLSTLSRKTVEELVDVTGRDGIKGELVSALNERFGANTVLRVYFPQYVVQ